MTLPQFVKIIAHIIACIAFAFGAAVVLAGEYAREPCAVADILRTNVDYASTVNLSHTLKLAAAKLESEAKNHDIRCDRNMKEGSPEELACALEKRNLQEKLAAHDRSVERHQVHVGRMIDQAITRLDQRMATTRTLLSQTTHSAERWTRDMQEWIDLGKQARHEAQVTAFEKSVGLAVEGIKLAIDGQLVLSEQARNSYQLWYARSGQAFPAAMRAPIEQRILSMRAGRDVTEMLTYIYDQHGRAYAVVGALESGNNWEAAGQAVAGSLKLSLTLGQASPEAKLAVDISELLLDDSYGWMSRIVAENRVQELIVLQETQLDVVKVLSTRYVADVKEREALAVARAQLESDACR